MEKEFDEIHAETTHPAHPYHTLGMVNSLAVLFGRYCYVLGGVNNRHLFFFFLVKYNAFGKVFETLC